MPLDMNSEARVPTIRSATQVDVEPITRLLCDGSLPHDGFRDHIGGFIVAVRDEVVCGCAGIEHYGPHGLLRSVAVSPAERGKGTGKLLVAGCIERARERGVTSLVLLTTSAEEYFSRIGFSAITRDRVPTALLASEEFRGACPESAVAMSLSIEP